MEILIIGGNGVLGNALQAQCNRNGIKHEVAKTLTTTEPETIRETPLYNLYEGKIEGLNYSDFSRNKIAILLAGMSSPTEAHSDKPSSYKINFIGTIKLLETLEQYGYWTFFVSSVEVFPGKKINYKETDSPEPLNWYGHLKYRVEEYIRTCLRHCVIIRTGWNIPTTQSRAGRDPVEVTYKSLLSTRPQMVVDQYFTPIGADDFSASLLQFAKTGISDERIIHIASSEVFSRSDFADSILKKSKNKQLNNYKKAFYNDFYDSAKEPRGRINGLSNGLLLSISPITFSAIDEIIEIRIRQLDTMYRMNSTC